MKKIKPLKNHRLQGLTDAEVKTAFNQYKTDKDRSESQAVEILIKEGLKARGYLK